jgi:plasmid stabilization system protein ParE
VRRPVRFEPRAERDLDRLRGFLEAFSPEVARRAARSLRAGILGLSDFPDQGAPINGGRRELYLRFGDSGYVVQYRVDPDAILVARIFHLREDR